MGVPLINGGSDRGFGGFPRGTLDKWGVYGGLWRFIGVYGGLQGFMGVYRGFIGVYGGFPRGILDKWGVR